MRQHQAGGHHQHERRERVGTERPGSAAPQSASTPAIDSGRSAVTVASTRTTSWNHPRDAPRPPRRRAERPAPRTTHEHPQRHLVGARQQPRRCAVAGAAAPLTGSTSRGSRARRARRRSTSSRVPGPRHGTTGIPRRVTSVDLHRALDQPHPPGQPWPADSGSRPARGGVVGEGVDAHHVSPRRASVTITVVISGVSSGESTTTTVPGGRAQPQLPGGEQVGPPRLHPREQLLSRRRWRSPSRGRAPGRCGRARAARPGRRPGGGGWPARRRRARPVSSVLAAPSTPAARTDVGHRVEQDHHRAVLLGARAHGVQLAGAQRRAPVDPAQPVAGLEGPDRVELRAVAGTARAVLPDQADGVRVLPGGEGVGLRQRHHRGVGQPLRSPPVAAPGAGGGDHRAARRPQPPPPRADRRAPRARRGHRARGGARASPRRAGRRRTPAGPASWSPARGRRRHATPTSSRVLWPSCSQRSATRTRPVTRRGGRVGQRERGHQAEGRGQHEQVGAAQGDAGQADEHRDREGADHGAGEPPAAALAVLRQAGARTTRPRRVRGPRARARVASSASTTVAPEISVIQSSGLTVIRWPEHRRRDRLHVLGQHVVAARRSPRAHARRASAPASRAARRRRARRGGRGWR